MRHLYATAFSLALLVSTPARSEAAPSSGPVLADEAATRTHCNELAEIYLKGDESVFRERFYSMMAAALALMQQDFELAENKAFFEQLGQKESFIAMARGQVDLQFQSLITSLRRSPAIDQEYVSTERFGSAALRHAHLLRFEDQGWRLDCAYFRGKDGWMPRAAIPQAEFNGGLFSAPPGTTRNGARAPR